MAGAVAYLDSSALVKLIVAEPESAALQVALSRWPQRASAALVRTEVVRALYRSGNHARVPEARRLFGTLSLVRVDETLLDRAGDLAPADLRSLDAIHLAAALELGDDLGVLLAYDARLREAAQAFGLRAEAPG